jgi:hypothetical protein
VFPSALAARLRSLPSGLLQNLLVIRGKGTLRLRIDQVDRVDAIDAVEELASFAQQALADWKI